MGVYYRANFGFGIQVVEKEPFEDDFYMGEFLEEILQGSKYRYFEVGEGSYTGEENDWYIIVLKDYLLLDNLKEESIQMLNFLEHNGIEYIGYPDIVGGLHVY